MCYKFKIIFFVLTFLLIGSAGFAADIYVDQTLSQNITDGKYSIENRNNSGSDGNAYTTVQAAINAMNPGDHIYMRGGTYQEGYIHIPTSKNPANGNWTDNYNLLASYPEEWAVLDGQNNIVSGYQQDGVVLGHIGLDDASSPLAYWKFERFEVKNGRNSSGTWAGGIWVNSGPFWFRYLYVHDNYATTDPYYNNPAGLKGYNWQDSIVEYCWFERNGALNSTHHNCAHIQVFSDYDYREICENGFDPDNNGGRHLMRNEYRYNYFDGTGGVPVAIKHKGKQYFTNHNENMSWNETYNTWGSKIHHNIVYNHTSFNGGALQIRQDFAQIYNNIVDSCDHGISVGQNPTGNAYKVCTWNNLVYNAASRSLWRTHTEEFGEYAAKDYWGYDYNNIIYSATDGWNWCDLSIDEVEFEPGEADFSHYVGKNNYMFDPDGNTGAQADLYWIKDQRVTQTEYESIYTGNNVYTNVYDAGNPLFKGSSGADRYKTFSSHAIESGKNVGNAGVNTPHPYLSGVTIPGYVGPVDPDKDSGLNWNPANPDPDDGGWIDYVLSLQSIETLRGTSTQGEEEDPLPVITFPPNPITPM